ncbi:MAG: hypothetical protein R3D51_11405 [Hyphomicrobiaceae bacterium]
MANIARWSAAAVLASTVALSGSRVALGEPGVTSAEPMVEPVKRVAPKTPDLSPSKSDKKPSSNAGSNKPRKVDLVGAKPNCDQGYAPDSAGKSCVKIAGGKAKKKSGKKN